MQAFVTILNSAVDLSTSMQNDLPPKRLQPLFTDILSNAHSLKEEVAGTMTESLEDVNGTMRQYAADLEQGRQHNPVSYQSFQDATNDMKKQAEGIGSALKDLLVKVRSPNGVVPPAKSVVEAFGEYSDCTLASHAMAKSDETKKTLTEGSSLVAVGLEKALTTIAQFHDPQIKGPNKPSVAQVMESVRIASVGIENVARNTLYGLELVKRSEAGLKEVSDDLDSASLFAHGGVPLDPQDHFGKHTDRIFRAAKEVLSSMTHLVGSITSSEDFGLAAEKLHAKTRSLAQEVKDGADTLPSSERDSQKKLYETALKTSTDMTLVVTRALEAYNGGQKGDKATDQERNAMQEFKLQCKATATVGERIHRRD